MVKRSERVELGARGLADLQIQVRPGLEPYGESRESSGRHLTHLGVSNQTQVVEGSEAGEPSEHGGHIGLSIPNGSPQTDGGAPKADPKDEGKAELGG